MSSVLETDKSSASDSLPLIQRISYGSLDVAGNLLYCFGSTYILYFYTDVAGISLAVAGIILLLARIVDGIDAPVWGIIIDKTHSRYGKCRPWFLWLPLPFAVFSALSFWSPDISMTGKTIYSAISYMLASILFTGLNTPLSAILPLMTLSPKERLVLNSYRMTGGQIGVLLMNATALPLVAFLGNGNDKAGFIYTAIVFSVISCALTLFAFKNIRELDTDKIQQEPRLPMKKSFSAMKGNWPWILMVLANLIFWIALQQRNTTIVYYLNLQPGSQRFSSLDQQPRHHSDFVYHRNSVFQPLPLQNLDLVSDQIKARAGETLLETAISLQKAGLHTPAQQAIHLALPVLESKTWPQHDGTC